MSLNHRDCEAFLAVAESGSFDQAGLKLNITTAAISLRVQSLERSIGQTLIIRERPCRVTNSGKILVEHLLRQKRQEENVLQLIQGKHHQDEFYRIHLATNADSLETWLLPMIAKTLSAEKIILQLKIDDQSQTHQLMESGHVTACISSESQAMKGCVSIPLFQMRYLMVCTPEFKQEWFSTGLTRDNFRSAPAVIFNDKDQLHTDVMIKLFGLPQTSYPYHYVPSSKSFAEAIELGMGYGMVPELQIRDQISTGKLICLLPEATQNIELYWHHWKNQSSQLEKLTQVLTNTIIKKQ